MTDKKTNKEAKKESKKPSKEAKKEEAKSYISWIAIFIFIALVFGFLGYKYLLTATDEIKKELKTSDKKVEKIKKPEPIDLYEQEILESDSFEQPAILDKEVFEDDSPEVFERVEEPKQIQEEKSQIEIIKDIVKVRQEDSFNKRESNTKKLAIIERKQDALILYLAAYELRENLDNETEFYRKLDFLKVAAQPFSQLLGKVDILSHSAANGVPTTTVLKKDFMEVMKQVKESEESSLWKKFEGLFDDVVKVTKIQGDDVNMNTYSISKRVEIALDKGDIDEAIKQARQLRAPAREWVKEAKNLDRMLNIIDDISEFARVNLGRL